MGFKLSRLAQVVMAAVICSSTCLAAEKTDDFYIEIKGPDSKAQPIQQSQPQVSPSTRKQPVLDRIPHPYIPEGTRKPILSSGSEFYGPVKKTDTAWSIANNIRKSYPKLNLSNQKIMNALHRKNPQAFAGRSVESLLAGSRLAIPSLSEISTTNIRPVSKKTTVVALAKNEDAPLISKPQTLPPTVIEKKEETIAPPATTSVAANPMVNSTVVASTEPALVDSKVTALVEGGAATTTAVSTAKPTAEPPVVAPLDNSELLVYQTENKELKDKIQQLNEQIGHLQANMQNQEELKQELDTLQAQLKEHETAKPKLEEQKPDETVKDGSSGSFWHDIMSTPLNLLLLISLPVLAILVVLSFWLRSRAKRQMAAREQEMAETTTLMMDDANSDFGELLAVDLSDNEQSFPDLNLEDESLIPATIASEQADKDLDAALQDISIPTNVFPEIADEEPYTQQTEINLNADDELSNTASTDVKPQDFSMILSDADLASALEDDFSFSATDNEPENDVLESFNVDLSESSENTPIDVASELNLDKLMADPGVKMSDQLVSEVTGWEVSADDDRSSDLVSATQSNVNLKEVNDDSNKPWLQQFEHDQLKTENEAVIPDDYLSIDELLAQADKQDSAALTNPDSMQPNLDIGLDEFPDMLPEHDGVDIDDDGGVGAKMDLARAYLEIDDKASAKELLLEVQAQGNSDQIKEAEKLLSRIA